jgi:hypothetical protein
VEELVPAAHDASIFFPWLTPLWALE